MPTKKAYGVAVFTVLFSVLLIGNVFQIEDYDGVSYRNHTDVIYQYPSGPNGSYWDNSSTTNIMVNTDGWLMADQNDYAQWVSEPLRINDNRKIVYEADTAGSEIGITIQVSDLQNFSEIKDVQKATIQEGFREIDLNLERGEYTRVIIEFDKAAESTAAVNDMSVRGIRSDLQTGFSDVLGLGLFMLLFWFGIRVFGSVVGWW